MSKYLVPVLGLLFLTFVACQAVKNQYEAGQTKIACEALSDISPDSIEVYFEGRSCYVVISEDPIPLDLESINQLITLFSEDYND